MNVSLFLDRKTKCNVQMRQFVIIFTITELLKPVQQMLIICKNKQFKWFSLWEIIIER